MTAGHRRGRNVVRGFPLVPTDRTVRRRFGPTVVQRHGVIDVERRRRSRKWPLGRPTCRVWPLLQVRVAVGGRKLEQCGWIADSTAAPRQANGRGRTVQ